MILRLLTLPLLGPIEGVAWIGEQLLERADAEIDDKENLQKRLLALQLAFDMGEISEEDFEVQEEEILLAMQAAAEAEEAD
ncbi:gas vesicle protein GvpG [Desertifilum sp. FACHB-1129]|uniref:Gas vesicle protein GvpG n=2 Tax=Desertifilum tharense IPPAS B-1220 TaxID=1781255 RepID=A0A1E5QKG5_9CYAN|nr:MULTISPECIES: gas vesicle protein GvpG [Desertifilum]MDA0209767.1 gas vesicle protein GvpG [Cyanobacteria bacterium FC1]MBD2310742.1 gas vesicle protein GvpG [Desertifilum sp. FACHB-1129]MBD2320779.1 gas vesicle protein GvpG [Desertifilum sp. FACHB-866]MBD2330907.1 gas vesicle protein GvpG [Desertifilum sp. FACHB-868]OEJ75160.1 gas vesicle protein GvpG [Desertifilum tharense IPPAS B-1220]